MSEAAEDWKHLGEDLLKAQPWYDLKRSALDEKKLLAELKLLYGKALDGDRRYARIIELGRSIFDEAKRHEVDPDGYLGSQRIARGTFAFLAEYGFAPVDGTAPVATYSSGRVVLDLGLPSVAYSGCSLKQTSDPSGHYFLEDIVFMAGRSESLSLPPGLSITSEVDVQDWFSKVADILRHDGRDLLEDKPGAFGRLARAQAGHDRRVVEEMQRLRPEE